MSIKKYEADSGSIHRIRLGKGNAAVTANTEPTGAVDSNIRVKVSKSNREFGLRPRTVGLTRVVTAGSGATELTVTKRSSLPVLTATVFDSTPFAIGQTLTISTVVWTIASKNPEDT
jgi:hypothetical protein